ncbi:beta-lactamase [Streptomyces xiamenensis]|uniref:Beta-lactamase n=1 Tax=Streptomyces xiamenensis TaxID=408015 RepID=A0A0F7FWJ9_9ACTN|nr:serine hydrolase [Streptomyces xiamenensis]AKG44378.1 beta-lactamase [Streptomyces xiamenensis]
MSARPGVVAVARALARPGFVVLAVRDGVVLAEGAGGWAVRWGAGPDGPVELPVGRGVPPAEGRWSVPMTVDTVFDLASLTKLYTALLVARAADEGLLDLDAPVGRYVPEVTDARVTLRLLLAHRGGMAADLDLAPYGTRALRLAAVFGEPPVYVPGEGERYSDLGLITAGVAVERAAGAALDVLLERWFTGPLGLVDTGFRPAPERVARCAATEYQPWTGRGMVRGEVHDEKAFLLGGVAGHAGVFGTAREVAVLAQVLLNGGRYGGVRVLSAERAALWPGWERDRPAYMGALASPRTYGHTGFTGTSVVADSGSGTVLVLLTNRVHPGRERPVAGVRAAVASAL